MRFCGLAPTLLAASLVQGRLHVRADTEYLESYNGTESTPETFGLHSRAPVAGGIGAEFETTIVKFLSSECDEAQTFEHRKHIVAGRTGKNFELTADSNGNKGELQAEYILDGKQIKIGTGDAVQAAKAVVADFVSPMKAALRDFLARD
jgi:hypothetical protein